MLGLVKLYTPAAKEVIKDILHKHLSKYKVEEYVDNILTCLDELIKNAIKANYKYVLIREELARILPTMGYSEEQILNVIKDRVEYSRLTMENVDIVDLNKKVRAALTQEAKVINMKTKALKANKDYSEEQKLSILEFTDLLYLRKLTKKYNVRVELRINEYWKALNMEIMNNAPILEKDLERIHSKRKEFREYADKGEETMFFINNMDESEGGAGLGYATIDSGLIDMNLDPNRAINIISVSNTTVLVNIKLSTLQELETEEQT